MRVLAALSGGVDSAVAAALALQAGHEVTGVHLALHRQAPFSSQASADIDLSGDARVAAKAAKHLGIGFAEWDLATQFEESVVQYLVDEYAAGRTPNPCVRCNQTIKFAELHRRAVALGFDAVCTGHYARVVHAGHQTELRRAKYLAKDQSYVLAAAAGRALARSLFPLGEIASKDQVRQLARDFGLPLADQPESQDICFVADAGLPTFLRSRLGARPGVVIDQAGQVVAHHTGAYQFTVGQRRGLHLTNPAVDGQPRYVTAIDAASGVVRVGSAADLEVSQFDVSDLTWLIDPPVAPFDATVQVRAHGRVHPCQIAHGQPAATGSWRSVVLRQPIRGLAGGQLAVFYRDDLVVAQGTIER